MKNLLSVCEGGWGKSSDHKKDHHDRRCRYSHILTKKEDMPKSNSGKVQLSHGACESCRTSMLESLK
jgi:hypothetical protein